MGTFTTAATTWTTSQVVTAANLNAQLRDFINGFGAFTSYTPTWGSTGTAPAIGNGSLVGGYTQVGKTVFFRAGVTFGTTTTFGTGNYTLSLPATPIASTPYWQFQGSALQGGVVYTLMLLCNGGSATAAPYYISTGTTGASSRVGQTTPVTWTAVAGNGFWFCGSYEAL